MSEQSRTKILLTMLSLSAVLAGCTTTGSSDGSGTPPSASNSSSEPQPPDPDPIPPDPDPDPDPNPPNPDPIPPEPDPDPDPIPPEPDPDPDPDPDPNPPDPDPDPIPPDPDPIPPDPEPDPPMPSAHVQVDFGTNLGPHKFAFNVAKGKVWTGTIEVESSSEPVTVNSVSLTGTRAFQKVSDSCTGRTLRRNPQIVCFIEVRFHSTIEGVHSAAIDITEVAGMWNISETFEFTVGSSGPRVDPLPRGPAPAPSQAK
ncbi:hypothetical protein [Arthrobacter sp. RT-1]|uniref:hypothetical protein n=1 Tax=Arthrobacter sp. RT-1 TaxID=2292263 RepID=UPI0015F18134|nr:hypothetical protein [Arthrobacter sp. RT-1]